MDYQQPPPSHNYDHHHPPPPPPPPLPDHHQRPHVPPPPNTYYSSQFQYQYQHQHQYHPSPPPPPPPPPPQQQHQNWDPPPYPPPQHQHHYPAPHIQHSQYPSHLPPRPPPYHQPNQGFSNANWGPQQTWEFQAHPNEEDWAAKARAWAASKDATGQQQSDPLLNAVARLEEQTPYHDPHGLPIESQFPDMQQPTLNAPSYLQHAASATQQHLPPVSHPQEFASFSSGQSSFGNLSSDSAGAFHQMQQSSMSHQQEVPSSYSSIAGNGDVGQSGTHYMSSSFPPASAPHYLQPPLPAAGRSMPMEEQQYTFRGHSADPATSLSDQPLDFAPRYNHDYERHAQATYSDSGVPVKGVDNASPVPSNYSWGPAGSGVMYPSVPPVISPTSQVDPSMGIPSHALGHNSTTFGRLPMSNFQQSGPPIGPPYAVGVGSALHSPAAFPGDGFGVPDFSERPKKPSVPNWLREEIIKKKAVMTSSTMEHPGVDNQLMEDDSLDITYGKSEPDDSKSIDSSKSAEEEDEDEDDVEAARTAAINQEIKRVLTEVLLKVTDELFDEIATKVINEDERTVEEYQNIDATSNEAPIPPRTASTGIAEPKVVIPVKAKVAESDNANEKSNSTSPGDILGLASYASDDEDDDKEIQSSKKASSKGTTNDMESYRKKNISGKNLVESGLFLEGNDEANDKPAGLKIDAGIKKQDIATAEGILVGESKKVGESAVEEENMLKRTVNPVPKEAYARTARSGDSKTSTMEHLDGRRNKSESDKSDIHEMRRSSSGKDYVKDENIHKDKVNEKGVETRGRYDEKHFDREKNGDQSARKEKEEGAKAGDKGKDSDSRRRPSPSDVKETKKERDRDRKSSIAEENGGKKERIKEEKGEQVRHKSSKDSSRHKRHHSPTESRGKDSKDSSVFSEAGDSDEESAINSKRRRRSRRYESPSPVRSRRRHVSRSPHSRHSQQRHSHYTSSDSKRGRRSRSRSPVRSRRR